MKKLLLPALSTLALGAIGFLFISHQIRHAKKPVEHEMESPSEAGASFLYYGMARTFPDGKFHTEKYTEAFAQMRLSAQLRGERNNPVWEDLGPKNIGGRTLCLAVNPLDTNIIWAGSASGGLWKSKSAGRGAHAWERIETGFPVLGVSSIALDPSNPNIIYIGTGEVYNVENSAPNVAFRTTRGTYGIGILKSTNGGQTWSKSLDWSYGQLRGVQDIKINPLRPASVLAATTEGLLRSWDAGLHWHALQNIPMAVDIEINPVDTNKIYVTYGSLDDDAISGVYRSVDGGANFSQMSNGLPVTYSGKTLLTLCPTQPNVLYASVGDAFAQQGLFKTIDGGNSWTQVNTQDVCTYQGWYSHDVAVHPNDPNTFMWVGIDAWKSTNSGADLAHKSYWYKWDLSQTPVGGPEGPPDYVHADIHRVYYTPGDPNKLYFVCDGGIFVSYDGGETFDGRNGGYQTQQFYSKLGNSSTDENKCIGGMQDNATAIYVGDPSWIRAIGGDGECTAINPDNDQIMYGSSQYLNMLKSVDGGQNWYGIGGIGEEAAFNGPFRIAPSNPNIMYAGAQSLWRSDDAGESWVPVTNGFVADGDFILSIAISPNNPDLVYCSTAPSTTSNARVFKINVATQTVTQMQGLPNRLCMDLAFYPDNEEKLVAVFAGFNTEHVWETSNGGNSWAAIDSGLPDVPTNAILVDPTSDFLYIGNDLGVWISKNGGNSWDLYSADAPQAFMAMTLSIAPNHKLRVGTYGLGVWQTDLAQLESTHTPLAALSIQDLYPNPASDHSALRFSLRKDEELSIRVVNVEGQTVWQRAAERLPAGVYSRQIPVGDLPAGSYGVVLEGRSGKMGRLLVVRR